MTAQSMTLPFNIPWTQIAVSPDMMDTAFCNKTFPFAWRSSLAISVYEPTSTQIPGPLCGRRLTYLKVTASITGYQPNRWEMEWLEDLEGPLVTRFPDIPVEDVRETVSRITDEYFACYGALLNVAVFPHGPTKKELKERHRFVVARLGSAVPGTSLPNPFHESAGLVFTASDRTENKVIDIHPAGGDGAGELDLAEEMTIEVPVTPGLCGVEAVIVHRNNAAPMMEAFRGAESLGIAMATVEPGIPQTLRIEAEDISAVVIRSPQNESSMLEFAYFVGREVPIELDDYPHIIAMEPQRRDLYQAATDTGELLTSSRSTISTDKTATHTETSESGLSLSATYAPEYEGTKASELTGSFSHKWGSTDQDQRNIHTDDSRERRETQGTTTQLSQMYNLLTGYHQGTNRAAQLMLARPHVMQPTDFRTFVQGLRAIEGVQEFFFVVSRPDTLPGLSVEVGLETGHFPENAEIIRPQEAYDEDTLDFVVTARVKGDGWGPFGSAECRDLSEFPSATRSIPSGWIVDTRPERRRGTGDPIGSGWDPGHHGVADLDQGSGKLPDHINYQASDGAILVSGEICGGENPITPGKSRTFRRRFRAFIQSEQPVPTHEQPRADLDRLLITTRGLCATFLSGDPCPNVLPQPKSEPPIVERLVEEPLLHINPALLTRSSQRSSRVPAMKSFLGQIRTALTNGVRSPRRRPQASSGFLDSDYLRDKLLRLLPEGYLDATVGDLTDLPPIVSRAFGASTSVRNVLGRDYESFRKTLKVSHEEASALRISLLGLPAIAGSGPDDSKPPAGTMS